MKDGSSKLVMSVFDLAAGRAASADPGIESFVESLAPPELFLLGGGRLFPVDDSSI